MFVIIDKTQLTIIQACNTVLMVDEPFMCLEIPESLDLSYLKVTESEGIYTIEEDTVAMNAAAKQVAGAAIMAQCEADLDVKMLEYIGTSDRVSALAYSNTWKDMIEAPAEYIGPLFADEGSVIAYANTKIVAAREYAKYRMARIAQRNADIAAL